MGGKLDQEQGILLRLAQGIENLVALKQAELEGLKAQVNQENQANQSVSSQREACDFNDDQIMAYLWQVNHQGRGYGKPIIGINAIPLELLSGIEEQKQQLLENTLRFAKGLPANNALLWGARGTGKSSMVKSIHSALWQEFKGKLVLIEILREDVATLSTLLGYLRNVPNRRFILFCDDLSFESGDFAYKSLKAVLEGGIEGKPENVIFYATSNRRHLMSRDMIENERATAINPSEVSEEKISLSDRFGLWLGFHNYDQSQYLAIVKSYINAYDILEASDDSWQAEALAWSITRGARSGRVAFQFIQDLAARNNKKLILKH